MEKEPARNLILGAIAKRLEQDQHAFDLSAQSLIAAEQKHGAAQARLADTRRRYDSLVRGFRPADSLDHGSAPQVVS